MELTKEQQKKLMYAEMFHVVNDNNWDYRCPCVTEDSPGNEKIYYESIHEIMNDKPNKFAILEHHMWSLFDKKDWHKYYIKRMRKLKIDLIRND